VVDRGTESDYIEGDRIRLLDALGPIGGFVSGLVTAALFVGGLIKKAFVNPVDETAEKAKKKADKNRKMINEISDMQDEIEEIREQAERADDRSEQHRFVLFGDPDDPNQEGLAQDVHQIREEDLPEIKEGIDRLEEKMDG
jgi:fructose-1,6-bisphosphatase/inositol monophosphatase family enzyme